MRRSLACAHAKVTRRSAARPAVPARSRSRPRRARAPRPGAGPDRRARGRATSPRHRPVREPRDRAQAARRRQARGRDVCGRRPPREQSVGRDLRSRPSMPGTHRRDLVSTRPRSAALRVTLPRRAPGCCGRAGTSGSASELLWESCRSSVGAPVRALGAHRVRCVRHAASAARAALRAIRRQLPRRGGMDRSTSRRTGGSIRATSDAERRVRRSAARYFPLPRVRSAERGPGSVTPGTLMIGRAQARIKPACRENRDSQRSRL